MLYMLKNLTEQVYAWHTKKPQSRVHHFVKKKNSLSKVRGHAVAQLVEALRYKPEGRGFDSRCRNFSST